MSVSAVKSHFEVVYRGNPSAPQTLVFAHGWPDTDAVFQKQYDAFGDDYRIATVVIPGYRPGSALPYFGFSFNDLVVQLYSTITEEIMKGRSEKPILIAHDWGAALSYQLTRQFPDVCKKLVGLDIGGHVGKITFKATLIVLAYQWSLIFAFLLPRFLGTPFTRGVARVMSVPKATTAVAHSNMNYMYLQYWKGLILKTLPAGMSRFEPPQCKVLYMYGTNKPFFFHSTRWFEHLEKQEGSKVVPMRGGHWFFSGRSEKESNEEIKAFLESP